MGARPGAFARFRAYLRRHPILFLALLTPGIPEYLSGSSAFANIVLSPVWFLLGLAFNLGMYLPGVLLIREAQVRWNKGWATVLALGAAYAIVEEGIGLSTMFYPGANPVGAEGLYGYSFGVSWVWVPEVMLIHMVFSIGVPLLLFGYAFPELTGRSLLSRRGVAAALVVLTADIALLVVFVSRILGFWMGDGVLAGALLAVAGICLLSYYLPKHLIRPLSDFPRLSPGWFVIVGCCFFPGYLTVGSILELVHLPAALVALAIPVYAAAFLGVVLRYVGRTGNERRLLALAFGLILPVVIIGLAVQIVLPFVFLADLLMIAFFLNLYRRYPTVESTPVTALRPTPG